MESRGVWAHILGSNGWDFQSINTMESQPESAKKNEILEIIRIRPGSREFMGENLPSSFPLIGIILPL